MALLFGLVFVAFMTFMFWDMMFEDENLQRVRRKADDFVAHVSAGDFEPPYGLVWRGVKRRIPLEQFEQAIRNTGAFQGKGVEFLRREYVRTGDTATLQGVVRSAKGDTAVTFHLKKGRLDWFFTNVVVAGTPLLPRN